MKRSGFASVAAIICLSLVGVTVAAIMSQITNQAHRTAREIDRAQQQQISIAKSRGPVELPEELRSR